MPGESLHALEREPRCAGQRLGGGDLLGGQGVAEQDDTAIARRTDQSNVEFCLRLAESRKINYG